MFPLSLSLSHFLSCKQIHAILQQQQSSKAKSEMLEKKKKKEKQKTMYTA
jgi:hypothetical protein